MSDLPIEFTELVDLTSLGISLNSLTSDQLLSRVTTSSLLEKQRTVQTLLQSWIWPKAMK